MTRDEFIQLVSPSCRECGQPIVRTEIPWVQQGIDWVPGQATMICPDNHRMPVELLDS